MSLQSNVSTETTMCKIGVTSEKCAPRESINHIKGIEKELNASFSYSFVLSVLLIASCVWFCAASTIIALHG